MRLQLLALLPLALIGLAVMASAMVANGDAMEPSPVAETLRSTK